MSDLLIELRSALKHSDLQRLAYLRGIGLEVIAKMPGTLSEQALGYLAHACHCTSDRRGLKIIAQELPQEIVPRNANVTIREMAHLQLTRGYVYIEQNDLAHAVRCFHSASDLASFFGDSELQALAQLHAAHITESQEQELVEMA